jgi:hypothetical protein
VPGPQGPQGPQGPVSTVASDLTDFKTVIIDAAFKVPLLYDTGSTSDIYVDTALTFNTQTNVLNSTGVLTSDLSVVTNRARFGGGIAVTGSAIVTTNVTASNLVATGNIFAQGITGSISQTLQLVALDTTNGRLYYAQAPSQIAGPTNIYTRITSSTNVTFNSTSTPTIFELNGGTIQVQRDAAGSTGRLVVGLADVVTDYQVSVVNISGGSSLTIPIQITTPASATGVWDVYFTGYVSSTNEIFWELINVSGSTGALGSRNLDQSGRVEVSLDYSSRDIVVWGSNWA